MDPVRSGSMMWEKLTLADLDRARHELALERGAMLSRYRAELKELDARYDQVEKLNRLIGAFTEKYLNTNTPIEPREEAFLALNMQRISPNLALRRLVSR